MGTKKEIDYLKAFAIFLVVFYHAVFTARLFDGNMFFMCLQIALRLVHVPLFIMIAGYLCHKQDILQFYRKKADRILIPFLFMSFLKLVYNNLISAEHIHEGSIWEQIFDAYICGGTYWFCYCLLVIFAIAPLLWGNRKRIWAALAVFSAANIFIQWNEIRITDILQIGQVIYHLPFFLVGMLLWSYKVPERLRKTRAGYILIPVSLCIAGICGYFRFFLDIYYQWYVDFLFGLGIMYLLYCLACVIRGKAADHFLGTMGKYSLQIMFFDSFFREVLFLLICLIMDVSAAAALIVTVLDLALCCLTSMLAGKVPVLSRLCGLKE